MNTFRRMIFFFLAIFVLVGVNQVSANHFAITDATFTSVNGTSFVVSDTVLSIPITFNITNLTALEGDSADDADIVNITVAAIGNDNQQIVLGFNDTSPLVISNGDEGNTTFNVEVVLNFSFANLNASVLSTTANTLNITFQIWNLTGDGNINESVSDTDQSFTFYVSGPLVTIKFLDINDNEKTTFEATDKVKIVCTRSSAYTGISFNNTNVSIQVPGGNGFDSLESSSTRASAATDFEVEFTQTRELGDYTAACFSVDDNAFLNDTVNSTFTIVTKPPRSTSAFANPSFQRPEGQKIVSESEDLGKVSEQGTSRLLKKGALVKVDIKGETHTITVKELSLTALTLTIESTPQEITFNKGETKEVDVDGDGQNDLAITFHQQYKTGTRATADVTLKAISTPAEPKKDTTKEPTTNTDDETSKGSFAGSAIVTIIVIVAIVVIGFALIRGKKR